MINEPLRQLTWTTLLARWMEFAQAAVAWPDDAAGKALRSAVVDIITLQAVTMALRELAELPPAEQALGRDRAKVLIDKHTAALRRRAWPDGKVPVALEELMREAEEAMPRLEA